MINSRLRPVFQTLLRGLLVAGICVLAAGCDAAATTTPVSQPSATPLSVTPAAGKGGVVGELWEFDRHVPNANGVLYLGDVLTNTQGTEAMASLDASTAPRAYTNSAGAFVFNDIQPNEYILATVTPRGYIFLVDPDSGRQVRFAVKAGELLNLGKVYVDLSAFR